LRNLNLTFKIPKTFSISFRTLSRFFDQRIVGLPGTLFLYGEMRHGPRWYPPSQMRYTPLRASLMVGGSNVVFRPRGTKFGPSPKK
jgi:hypothetical protein